MYGLNGQHRAVPLTCSQSITQYSDVITIWMDECKPGEEFYTIIMINKLGVDEFNESRL